MLAQGGIGFDRRQTDEDQVAGHDAGEHLAEPEEGAIRAIRWRCQGGQRDLGWAPTIVAPPVSSWLLPRPYPGRWLDGHRTDFRPAPAGRGRWPCTRSLCIFPWATSRVRGHPVSGRPRLTDTSRWQPSARVSWRKAGPKDRPKGHRRPAAIPESDQDVFSEKPVSRGLIFEVDPDGRQEIVRVELEKIDVISFV